MNYECGHISAGMSRSSSGACLLCALRTPIDVSRIAGCCVGTGHAPRRVHVHYHFSGLRANGNTPLRLPAGNLRFAESDSQWQTWVRGARPNRFLAGVITASTAGPASLRRLRWETEPTRAAAQAHPSDSSLSSRMSCVWMGYTQEVVWPLDHSPVDGSLPSAPTPNLSVQDGLVVKSSYLYCADPPETPCCF